MLQCSVNKLRHKAVYKREELTLAYFTGLTDFICHITIGFESLIWHLDLCNVSFAGWCPDFSNLQFKGH